MKKDFKKISEENKKKINAEISRIDSIIDAYKSDKDLKAFEEGRENSTITVNLSQGEIYKEYSGHDLLNHGIYDFVEDAYDLFNNKLHLTIHFIFPEDMGNDEKERIKKIFKTHYAIKFKNNKEKNRKQLILSLIFLFTGFFLITIHLLYTATNSTSVYGEILDIFAWVFVWEACETMFVNSID